MNDIANFLISMFYEGCEISSIAQYKSALSTTLAPINGIKVGQDPSLSSLIKGFAKARPKKANLTKKWSIDAVLQMIESWGDNWELTPQKITWKTAMLMALTASNRCSELSKLDCKYMTKLPDGIVFQHTTQKKNIPSNQVPGKSYFPIFHEKRNLCPCHCIETYIKRTDKIRNENEENMLLRSYIKPYLKVSPSTVSRWITQIIKEAGFDVKQHQLMGHSARGKSASKAHLQGIPLQEILKAGDWKSNSTYARFYYRPDFNSAYGTNILRTALND